MKEHPPSQRDRRRVDPWEEIDLFHQDVEIEPSVVEALRSYCEDAFLGRRQGLGYFSIASLREDTDERSSVEHNSAFRLAA